MSTELDAALALCPHAARCPGCSLLGVPEKLQGDLKRASVSSALAPYAIATVVGATELAEETFHYRTRAKVIVSRAAVGLYARGSHEVIRTDGCRVLDPLLESLLAELREMPLFDLGVSSLDLRRVDEGAFLTLATEEGAELAPLRERFSAWHAPNVVGIAVSRRRAGSEHVLGTSHELLVGRGTARHHLAPDLPWHLATPGAFVQAHAPQASALYRTLLKKLRTLPGVAPGARILELHAGSGTLALSLAAAGYDVTAVEAFQPATDQLRTAAQDQGLAPNVVCADATTFLRQEAQPFAVVFVNPPRRGLEPALRRAIAEGSPAAIAYVSCDPKTLGRDLAHLALWGYAPTELTPYDLMPQAATVETLAWLERRPGDPPKVLFRDEKLIAVVKAPHEPTHPQGDGVPSLLDRVRRLPGAEQAVPVHRLDAETSGVCLFATTATFVEELGQSLASGTKTYLAWCKGITNKGGTIKKPVQDGRNRRDAETKYRRVNVIGSHSVVELSPKTGRRHQLRQHLRAIGHPILGDARYGHPASNQHHFAKSGLDRTFLHCQKIVLGAPYLGLELEAPLAPDLAAVWSCFTGDGSETRDGEGGRSP